MSKKRLVFITANDDNQIGILEWKVNGNLRMDTFDPIAVFNKAMKAHKKWDKVLNEPTESLVYVFYPEGNPGLIKFDENVDLTPGQPFRLSRVTEFQTTVGMMPV